MILISILPCSEFIHLIASEASDISERQQKKVISPEHVVEALSTLGFQEYVVDVKAVHKEYKEQASVSSIASLSCLVHISAIYSLALCIITGLLRHQMVDQSNYCLVGLLSGVYMFISA